MTIKTEERVTGLWAKECGQPLETGKDNERDSLQSLQGECSPDSALWTSDLQIYNKSVLFQATKYVAFATKLVGNSTLNLGLGGSYFLEKIHRIRLNSPGKCSQFRKGYSRWICRFIIFFLIALWPSATFILRERGEELSLLIFLLGTNQNDIISYCFNESL